MSIPDTTSHNWITRTWSGFATPNKGEAACVLLRLREYKGHIYGHAVVRNPDGEREYLRIDCVSTVGDIDPTSDIQFHITDYVSDRPNKIPPSEGVVRIDGSKSSELCLQGQYESQFTSDGHFLLYRASFVPRLSMLLPFRLRHILAGYRATLRRRLPHLYLLLVVAIILASAANEVPLSLSVAEAILLFAPLLLLFSGHITTFIHAISHRVRKVGPVEFASQEARVTSTGFSQAIQVLQEEFPQEAIFFAFISGALVTHTKTLLSTLTVQASPIDKKSLGRLAESVGTPKNNIDATENALLNIEFLTSDEDGLYQITERGRRFVQFENRLQHLLSS